MICIVNQYFIIYMVSLLVSWNNKYFFQKYSNEERVKIAADGGVYIIDAYNREKSHSHEAMRSQNSFSISRNSSISPRNSSKNSSIDRNSPRVSPRSSHDHIRPSSNLYNTSHLNDNPIEYYQNPNRRLVGVSPGRSFDSNRNSYVSGSNLANRLSPRSASREHFRQNSRGSNNRLSPHNISPNSSFNQPDDFLMRSGSFNSRLDTEKPNRQGLFTPELNRSHDSSKSEREASRIGHDLWDLRATMDVSSDEDSDIPNDPEAELATEERIILDQNGIEVDLDGHCYENVHNVDRNEPGLYLNWTVFHNSKTFSHKGRLENIR